MPRTYRATSPRLRTTNDETYPVETSNIASNPDAYKNAYAAAVKLADGDRKRVVRNKDGSFSIRPRTVFGAAVAD